MLMINFIEFELAMDISRALFWIRNASSDTFQISEKWVTRNICHIKINYWSALIKIYRWNMFHMLHI